MKAARTAVMICPANTRIDGIYAFISKDEQGNEGLCAATIDAGGTLMPLIAADPDRLNSLTPLAELIAAKSGKTITLVEFRSRVELRKITGPLDG